MSLPFASIPLQNMTSRIFTQWNALHNDTMACLQNTMDNKYIHPWSFSPLSAIVLWNFWNFLNSLAKLVATGILCVYHNIICNQDCKFQRGLILCLFSRVFKPPFISIHNEHQLSVIMPRYNCSACSSEKYEHIIEWTDN